MPGPMVPPSSPDQKHDKSHKTLVIYVPCISILLPLSISQPTGEECHVLMHFCFTGVDFQVASYFKVGSS